MADKNDPIASIKEENDLNTFEDIHPEDIARESSDLIEEAQKDFEIFKKTNPEVEERSLRIVKGILNHLHSAMTKLNNLKSDDK